MTHAEIVTLNDQADITSHVYSCDRRNEPERQPTSGAEEIARLSFPAGCHFGASSIVM
jgi:hypothetical protein